jgi:arginyl-tRNA synthetase
LFETPYADGPIIRFLVSATSLPTLLFPYIEDRKSSYGNFRSPGIVDSSSNDTTDRKKVVVEFSSPNVGKEFSGHHLRGTLVGTFVSNIYACMGWDVVRLNYLGDWGKELALLAIGFQKFGSDEALESDPAGHMLDIFNKIRELVQPELDEVKRAKAEGRSTSDIEGAGLLAERDAFFKNLESGDEDCTNLWKKLKELYIGHLDASYRRLGIKFDEYSGESQVKPETMAEVEEALKEQGVLEQIDDTLCINFEKHGGKAGKGLGTQAIRGRNGSTTYLLRDIAAALDREREHSFNRMIYVVSFRQDMHFQQVFLALKLMKREDVEGKLQHVSFGEIVGMADYFQRPLLLNNILDEYGIPSNGDIGQGGEASVEGGDTGQVNGCLRLLGGFCGNKRSHKYTLDRDRVAIPEQVPSVLLQQIWEDLGAAISALGGEEVEGADLDFSALQDASTFEILGSLARYPEMTAAAFKSLETHTVYSYLRELAGALADHLEDTGSFEGVEGVAVEDPAEPGGDGAKGRGNGIKSPGTRRAKLEFYRCARQVMENGLVLLGAPVSAGVSG